MTALVFPFLRLAWPESGDGGVVSPAERRERRDSGRTMPDARDAASTADDRPGAPAMTDSRTALDAARPADENSDEMLLRRYQEGEAEAFPVLMKRYRNELLHFLIRFLGSRAAAEDVFQETFLQIHISADSFDPTRRFKPWLFTIAANKARDHHRKNARRAAVSLNASIAGDGDERGSFVDLLEADLPSPASPLLDAERSRVVKEVMDGLPAHLREILLLSYFQRMSYNQIADGLDIPLGTVKSRLHTAVAAFARSWKATLARGQSSS